MTNCVGSNCRHKDVIMRKINAIITNIINSYQTKTFAVWSISIRTTLCSFSDTFSVPCVQNTVHRM